MVIKIWPGVSRSFLTQIRIIPGATVRALAPRWYLVYDPSAGIRSRRRLLLRIRKED